MRCSHPSRSNGGYTNNAIMPIRRTRASTKAGPSLDSGTRPTPRQTRAARRWLALGGTRAPSYPPVLGDRIHRPVKLVMSSREVCCAHGFVLASGAGGSRAGEWWVGGSEACDEDFGLPAGELVPVSCVREWLGGHRSGDDDVDRGGVGSDRPVAASAGEDLLE